MYLKTCLKLREGSIVYVNPKETTNEFERFQINFLSYAALNLIKFRNDIHIYDVSNDPSDIIQSSRKYVNEIAVKNTSIVLNLINEPNKFNFVFSQRTINKTIKGFGLGIATGKFIPFKTDNGTSFIVETLIMSDFNWFELGDKVWIWVEDPINIF